MNHNVEHLIEQAILALEDSNMDASWHFLRRAKNAVHSIAGDEREACAKLAEKLEWSDHKGIASAIRARGQL
jgi:hypothetical protein